MKKVRYYYSQPMYKVNTIVLSNHRGEFDPDKIIAYSKSWMTEIPRLTICAILNTETNEMSFGVAKCNPSDSFCRAIGRDVSLKNAMENPVLVAIAPKQDIGIWRMKICRQIEDKINGINYDRDQI